MVTYCSFPGCKSKRAPARDCDRKMCRSHCQVSGGCQRKDHLNKTPQRIPLSPPFLPPPRLMALTIRQLTLCFEHLQPKCPNQSQFHNLPIRPCQPLNLPICRYHQPHDTPFRHRPFSLSNRQHYSVLLLIAGLCKQRCDITRCSQRVSCGCLRGFKITVNRYPLISRSNPAREISKSRNRSSTI